MKETIFKIAGVKNDKEFYSKFPTEEAFMKKHGKEFKKAQAGAAVSKSALGPATNYIQPAMDVIEGLSMIGEQNDAIDEANQMSQLTSVQAQVAGLPQEQIKRKYIRPEDMIFSPNQLNNSYGTGTNILAKNGIELEPEFTPLIDPDNIKQYQLGGEIGGKFGDFMNEGGGEALDKFGRVINGKNGPNAGNKIGKGLGAGIGTLFGGPIGGMLGGFAGNIIGGLFDNSDEKIEGYEDITNKNMETITGQKFGNKVRNQYSGFLQEGGNINSNLNGELELYDGDAEHLSMNPYLPDGGETIMFRGASHAHGGIPISYGNNPVEVEGGEPAVKLRNGGEDNLVVYGNLQIPNEFIDVIGDPKAKGKKFKNYINTLSKTEKKQNNIVNKSNEDIDDLDVITSFDKLKLGSYEANLLGANMKLKTIAEKKQNAAMLQSAINDTASEFGVIADDLAKGKIKKDKNYNPNSAQDGTGIRPQFGKTNYRDKEQYPNYLPQIKEQIKLSPTLNPLVLKDVDSELQVGEYVEETESKKFPWMDIVNKALPYFRPSDATELDNNQLMGEYFALTNNQEESVQAQTYTPELNTPYDISYQDIFNANQSDFNSIEKQLRNNPEALAMLSAQKYASNQKVLGEQFRANQAEKMRVYEGNRNVLNDAELKNMSIFDQQYSRQGQAKANTKATTQAALNSIASKIAQNKLENNTLRTYENEYNYRFGKDFVAENMNPLFTPNIPSVGAGSSPKTTEGKDLLPVYDKKGNITSYKVKARNGSIVRAIKNL